jgi:hypothetical protein
MNIDMRDYRVKPPSPSFGALRVADVVTVAFDTVVPPPYGLMNILSAAK